MTNFKLSPSTLNLMQDCPRCFYLQIVKGIHRPRGIMSGIVMKMDSIIKKYFDKYRSQGKLPPIIEKQVKGKLPKDMPKTLYYKENGKITIVGKSDEYLELEDGSIVPFDHKTKSTPPIATHRAHQLQMDVYAYLVKMNGYKTTNKSYLAYYYPDDCDIHQGLDLHCKVVEVPTSLEKAKQHIKKAIEILELEEPPNPSKECEYCHWAKGVSSE